MLTEVEQAVEKYVGVPWRAQGGSRFGVDCIGLVIQVAFDIGLYTRDEVKILPYRQQPHRNTLIKEMSKYLKRIGQPQYGCVLTFGQMNLGLYHVGILGSQYFYEASMPEKRVTKVTISDTIFRNTYASFAFERP